MYNFHKEVRYTGFENTATKVTRNRKKLYERCTARLPNTDIDEHISTRRL